MGGPLPQTAGLGAWPCRAPGPPAVPRPHLPWWCSLSPDDNMAFVSDVSDFPPCFPFTLPLVGRRAVGFMAVLYERARAGRRSDVKPRAAGFYCSESVFALM